MTKNTTSEQVKELGCEEENTLILVHFIVYCFHFTRGNQCLQYCIQISTILSLACLIAKRVDEQKYLIDRYMSGVMLSSIKFSTVNPMA